MTTAAAQREDDRPLLGGLDHPGGGSAERPWLRTVAAGAALLLALVALAQLMDPRGYLGTDTGGKVVTLERMTTEDTWSVGVGYWAQELDPDAEYHPFFFTERIGDEYVNVTSLPMVLAARPLYEAGGYRLALVLPMLGAVGAAFAARAIAERVVAGSGWRAFWFAGLASPLTLYALDLWEHSIGAALVAWAVVAAMDRERLGHLRAGLGIGLLVGLAASMRTEALVFGLSIVVVTAALELNGRRRLREPVVLGVGASVGLVVMLLTNAVLELAVLGQTFRSGRAAAAAGSAGADALERLREAAATGIGLYDNSSGMALLFAATLFGCLAYLSASRAPATRHVVVLSVVVVLLYAIRMSRGLGFVPGLVAASPIALVGLTRGWREERARLPLLIVGLSLPIVWATQYTGGALPQWGARYLLPAGVVALAVGAAVLPALGRPRSWFFAGLAVAVTACGLAWMSVRTHSVSETGEALAAVADTPLISNEVFWLREVSTFVPPDAPWLSAHGAEGRAEAAAILAAAGHDRFLLLVDDDGRRSPDVPGYAAGETTEVPGVGGGFLLVEYTADLAGG